MPFVTGTRALASAAPWGTLAPMVVAGVLLVVAMSMGGYAQGKADAAVHAVAILALGMAVARWRNAPLGATQKFAFALLLAGIGVALLQLVPIASGVYQHLPGRRLVLEEMRAAGLDPRWMPMTLDPVGTRRAMLSLAAFLAMWMLCTSLTSPARVRLLKLAAVVAVPMALLGFAQASRKLDTTGANGLFENRNHYATLMAMMIPVALAAAREAVEKHRAAVAVAWHAAGVAMLLAAALSFSRMGLLLALLSALATLVLLAPATRRGSVYLRNALVSLAVGVVAVASFALDRLAARFGSDILGDLRWQYFSHAWVALRAYLPWGSGLGSFREVYAQVEPFGSLGEFTYANHAHNDVLQNTLEAGLPGLVLMLAFVGVVAAAALALFRGGSRDGWRRAALVSVSIPLLHSLVDYPLRTFACSIPLALGLAVLLGRSGSASPAER